MDVLPEALYRAAELRVAERRARQELGLADGVLMERAGSAAFVLLRERFARARHITVVCGPGNNGGDGLVLARLAKQAGLDATVLSPLEDRNYKGEAAAAYAAWCKAGGITSAFTAEALLNTEVLVDALFGIGLERVLEGVWLRAVESMNASGRPILALDIPSGLHADTGRVLGGAVRATATLSFIGLKAGMFTGEGREHCGAIEFDNLGIASTLLEDIPALARRISARSLRGLLVPRTRHAHKGDAGRVLVIGGQPGMPGAAQLTGTAAYRAGAGLVVLATHPLHAAAIGAAQPELIAHGVHDASVLKPLLTQASVLALGPGLGQGDWAHALWQTALAASIPCVVDADALNLLAGQPTRGSDWVLTPHPGEAARLLGTSVAAVQADRFAAARAITQRYGGVCVLKGSGTIICTQDDPVLWLCDRGNPGLATGGSGDVLTGIIAALIAQGLKPQDAARLGVWVHASAGDRLARAGERGLMAGDLFAPVRRILNDMVSHAD